MLLPLGEDVVEVLKGIGDKLLYVAANDSPEAVNIDTSTGLLNARTKVIVVQSNDTKPSVDVSSEGAWLSGGTDVA